MKLNNEDKAEILNLLYCIAVSDGVLSSTEEEILLNFSEEYNAGMTYDNCKEKLEFSDISLVSDKKELLEMAKIIIDADGYLKESEMSVFSSLYTAISVDSQKKQ